MRPTLTLLSSLTLLLGLIAHPAASADDPPAEGPLVKMLRGGKVPEARQGTVIEMIGKRGGASDLDFLLEQALKPEGVSTATRVKDLDALSDAALTRNVRPSGDLARLAPLVEGKGMGKDASRAVRPLAVRLAGLWKAPGLVGALKGVAGSDDSGEALRAQAMEALASVGTPEARAGVEALDAPGRPSPTRAAAVAALARFDAADAAERAAALLGDARGGAPGQDFTGLVAAFLNRQGGADKLASALGKVKLAPDTAKLALRAVYTLGHSDPSLVDTLTKAAGLDAEVKPLDKAAMDALVAEVAAKGDPARGEALFRRADVNCAKCHAVSGAGGGVGPDLSPIGATSPPDYLVNSIMVPDQAIKEEYQTVVVQTADGQVFQGIVVDKDDKRWVLREATGETRTVPAADVEDSKEGGSLMPKGLVNFLTRAEFVDLIRFLSEMGKPGPYAVRSTPTVQRWRVLKPVPEALARDLPDEDTFQTEVLKADVSRWVPAYGKVGGDLPVAEVREAAGSDVVYLRAEVEVSHGDKMEIVPNSADGVRLWVDNDLAPEGGAAYPVNLSSGRHVLTFRVDAKARGDRPLRVEVRKPPGSSAEYAVVGGR